ncbi:MAG TPA: phosphatase PAP2 family protein [Candidatus Acidoferrales bacterium]|nr:phosphatase PAP2 family protein [Candidatus Acidoferrales bacterium]
MKRNLCLSTITACFTLFLLSTGVRGQFITMRSSSEVSGWGKMSSVSLSAEDFCPCFILLPPHSDTAGQGGNNQSLNLFGNFGNNILDSFKGRNIYFHLTAVAATALLVTTNVDYDVEHFFNEHEEYGRWTRPIVYTGELLPFATGGGLFVYAKIKNDNETLGASFAVLQASLIEFMYNSALKAITGRPNPAWWRNDDMEDLSKTFRFGFLRGGIFWGWPSGHTATTMAVVSALTSYYPDKTWVKVAGYTWVAYTMLGVSSVNRGGMHWFSDAVAGALMSYAVGSTVGKYYRRIYNSRTSTGASSTSDMSRESIPLAAISFVF